MKIIPKITVQLDREVKGAPNKVTFLPPDQEADVSHAVGKDLIEQGLADPVTAAPVAPLDESKKPPEA